MDTMAIRIMKQKRKKICTLVFFWTLLSLMGAALAFFINLVLRPV